MDKKEIKETARRVLDPIVGILASIKTPPLFVSLAGLLLSFYGAMKTAQGSLFMGALFLVISGLCDVIDGALARHMNVVSRFGAFIDSTIDRITEFAYFGGIILYFVTRPEGFHPFQIIVAIIALAGSVLTSYTRARAEGLGFSCTVGMMERPERIALLTLGLLLGSKVLVVVLVFLAVSTVLTTFQRIFHVHQVSRPDGPA